MHDFHKPCIFLQKNQFQKTNECKTMSSSIYYTHNILCFLSQRIIKIKIKRTKIKNE